MFPTRKLIAAGVSLTAAVGFGVLLPASPAAAEVLPNSNSVHLGNYRVPATPPAYSASTPVLPETDGTTGRPTRVFMTGDASLGTNTQVLTASPGPGETTEANGPVYTAPSGFAHQTWYWPAPPSRPSPATPAATTRPTSCG